MASSVDQLTAAQSQAAAATAGYPLDSFEPDKLPSVNLFAVGPSDYAGAARFAAYWTAIAARAIRSRVLGASAGAYAARATASIVSFSKEGMQELLKEAANTVQQSLAGAQSEPGFALASSIPNKLRQYAESTAIAAAENADDSLFASLKRALQLFEENAKKIATAVVVGTGVITAAVVAGIVWWVFHRKR